MDLNKLYYFYIVAKHEHVTHAAQELHLSQPALTKAVKQLEEELGTTLITRHHRGIQLTACGRYLKTRLDSVFAVIDQLPDELSALRQETTQTIRLNVQVASVITTDAIVEYKAIHKHVNFQVFKDKDFEHSDISITTDSGIAYTLPPPRKQTVIDEEICIAVPSDRFPGTDAIDLRALAGEGFVTTTYARSFRTLCEGFCLVSGFRPRITFETDFPTTIRNLINAGAGIGFWPAFSFGAVSPSMRLLHVRQPICRRRLILSLHSDPSSEFAADFYNYLIDYMQKQKESLG